MSRGLFLDSEMLSVVIGAPKVCESVRRGIPTRVIGINVFLRETREAAGILSICVNFTDFSFVMAYNNKKVGAIFGCYINICV